MADSMSPPGLDERTREMVREVTGLFGKLFINRTDRKAVYRADRSGRWHWTALDEPFKRGDFTKHLTGEECLGTYLLARDSTVKFFAYDLDLVKNGKYMPCYTLPEIDENGCEDGLDPNFYDADLEASLHDPANPAHRWSRVILMSTIRGLMLYVKSELGLDALPVITGGGAHVIVPLPEPTLALDARNAAIECLMEPGGVTKVNDMFYKVGPNDELTVEIFPKQDSLDGKDYGNLIRLPFGWHHEAGIRTYTIDPEAPGTLWDWKKTSSIRALRALASNSGAT